MLQHAVPVQIIVEQKLSRRNGDFTSFVIRQAVQMNAKLGGLPWSIGIPLRELMVIGIDVRWHDDAEGHRKSYCAMVATTNMQQNAGIFFSAVSDFKRGKDLFEFVSFNFANALATYVAKERCLPRVIFIYRNGVAKGNIQCVQEKEVELIKAKLKLLCAHIAIDDVKFCYVVVSRRTNTRFFENNDNPMPGTVVDDVITQPAR